MNNLKEYLNILSREVIMEGRYSDAEKMHQDFSFELSQMKNNNVKPKYIDWAIKQLKNKNQYFNDKETKLSLLTIIDFLKRFDILASHGFIQNKDINSYNDLFSFIDVVGKADKKLIAAKEQKEKENKANKVFENEKYLVVEPLTKEASCKYGRGTKWCTASLNDDNAFKQETDEGNRLFYIFNKANKEKYAMLVSLEHDVWFWDSADNQISHLDLFDYFPEEDIEKFIQDISGNMELFNV